MMKSKIISILSSFETRRHVTREDRGLSLDISALNNRAIELQQGNNNKPPPRSTATQSEAEKTKRSQTGITEYAGPQNGQPSAAKSTGKAVPTRTTA
ncbi:GD11845 [Drosophila simulans]|uniref:GD11845 n=1 Tax=Drosophila simulans TaxID=7240 RepID=B4NVD0_DROSI|nr:GD11845 [Drosophila simulans]